MRPWVRFIASVMAMMWTVAAPAAPALSIDTTEEVVYVPRGTVSSNALTIYNDGDSTLTWTLTDRVQGRVIKAFDSPWTYARSMRYDATRDCLWLSYYNSTDVRKVSTGDGTELQTNSMAGEVTFPYGIEIEDGCLWATDYGGARYVKFNPDTMAVLATVPFPSGWDRTTGIAIRNGQFFATRYNSSDRDNIYRLNPTSGAVAQTFSSVEYFYQYYNHISYGRDGVWFGGYYTPKNEIKKFDPAKGRIRRVVEMPDWYESGYIRDQSFAGTNTQMWALTYQHDYHITGANSSKMQLLDVAPLRYLSESVDSGSIGAASSADVTVLFDARSAPSAIHRASLKIESDGGMREKPYVFVVHASGANAAPTADAGSNQVFGATAPTMPVTLDGSGSSDPNGDMLVYTWTEEATVIATGANPTLDMAPGVHDLTLRVEDLRGGVDTDTVRITLRAADIDVDDLYVAHPQGGGTAVGTVTIRNSGDKTLNWSVSDTVALDQSSVVREFPVTWVSSYSASAYPYTMAYDATRNSLWVGYYYDDDVGRINATSGAIIETKALGSGRRVHALDMEGDELWNADYTEKKFRRYNPDTMANTQTIDNPWGTGNGPSSMARDSGQFYASQYYSYGICKLNAASGAVEATHPVAERQYYYNHHDAIDGKVWYTRYTAPKTRIHCMDGTSGTMLKTLDMAHWDTAGQIYDLSFQSSTQCWMLTYNVKSDSKRWAHLVDLSNADLFNRSATNGSVAADSTGTFTVSLDTTGLSIGWHRMTLTFASDDPDEPTYEKEVIFIIHEDAPNRPPTADAGPDMTRNIGGVTAPFILELDGSDSTDPDGDTLFSTWTMDGEPVETTEDGLIELGAGTYAFELIVNDLRGGMDTNSFTMTVNAKVPLPDWTAWHGSYGNGHCYEPNEDWLENWPPVLQWVRTDLGGGGYSQNSGPIIDSNRVYHVSGSRLTCVNAINGKTIWHKGFAGGNPVPCVDEDRIYAGTKIGETSKRSRLYCYDKRTGAFLWKTGDIGPGGDADGSGEWISPTVHGDTVLYGGKCMNKYTGDILWTDSSAVHWERFDWGGRTLLLHSSGGQLVDPLTGTDVVYAGPSAANGEGWYRDRCVHGTNMVWTINAVHEIAGAKLKDLGDPGTVYYTQPLTLGDYGWFVQGGHGSGGTLKCVDLSDGTTWAVGGSTQLAVRDRVFSHGAGRIYMSYGTASGPVKKSYLFDPAGAVNLSELGYADQRIFIQAGSGLTCLYLGLSAPVLNNGSGAVWSQTSGTAALNGELVNAGNGGIINTGAPPTLVRVYWGSSDGGTDPTAWDHCEDVGPRTRGPFSTVVAADRDAVYYYRCFATNSTGGNWSSASQRFTTYDCAWDRLGLGLHWPFEDGSGTTVSDISGAGNHGRLVNTWNSQPITWNVWTDGIIGKGIDFRGNTILRCQPLNAPLLSDFTLAFWLSYTDTFDGNGTQKTIFTLSCSSGGSITIKVADASRTGWNRRLIGPAGWSRDALHDGRWHHVVLMRKGMTYLMYVDGVWNTSAGTSALTSFDQIAFTWLAAHDDVRLYRRALSAEEIRGLAELAGLADNGSWTTHTAVAGSDDAEEREADGVVYMGRTNLCLVAGTQAGDGNQKVGLRFPDVGIPRGAFIASATIQFRSAASRTGAACLLIRGQAADNAGVFESGLSNITARATTRAAVEWMPPAWGVGQAGPAQQTPDLVAVVQEVIDRDGWTQGNALAFVIGGTGVRIADAQEDPAGTPATLRVVWTDAPDMGGNGVQDAWERKNFGTAEVNWPELLSDADGDGMVAYGEYVAGTDANNANSVLKLRVRALSNGKAAVGFDACEAVGTGYEDVKRYYTLEQRADLTAGTSTTEVVWHEGFPMGDGAKKDTGGTAWSSSASRGTFQVVGNMFKAADTDSAGIWESETITIGGKPCDISVRIKGEGGIDATDYIKVRYSVDDGPEKTIAEYYDNFNGNAWTTVKVEDVLGWNVRVIIRQKTTDGGEVHYWDDIKITRARGSDWPAVPGLGNLLAREDGTVTYTNETPAAAGYYRVRATLIPGMPPVADAGDDQVVLDANRDGEESVTLDGSGSTDPNNDPMTYAWSTGSVEIATGESPTVILPMGTHTVTLEVSDPEDGSDTDTVEIMVAGGRPIADAGPDQLVYDTDASGAEDVTLDGSGSVDPNGDPLTFSWTTNGIEIATGSNATVSLPLGSHDVVLTVDDSIDGTASDTVKVVVAEASIPVGALKNGVACADDAVGTGYIMYSEQNVHTRFAANPPHADNAEHLIGVVYSGGQWYYDNNSSTFVFTPVGSDRLLAAVDFAADTVTDLQGTATIENGIARGYVGGDLAFTPNLWGGGANDGEFGVSGTYFIPNP